MSYVLAINAGSSSLKVAAHRTDTLERVAHVEAADLGNDGADHHGAVARVLQQLGAQLGRAEWAAIGHRIVHGGAFAGPQVVTPAVRAALDKLVPLVPLHQALGLAALDAASVAAPSALQVACFDTAFHRTMPDVARRYALPADYAEIVAYGFHGLSYEYIASVLPEHLRAHADGRVIVAHLGSGASMCALRGRRSIATTMGFTPLDGLVMGTRPGALDPGIVLYLIEQRGLSTAAVQDLLYHRCGLLGVSGQSASMKDLLASHTTDAGAAVDLFVYRCTTAIGSLAAALGGLDALVFTGGIGEHAGAIRDRIVLAARWLGDFVTCVIPTDEECVIATQARGLLQS